MKLVLGDQRLAGIFKQSESAHSRPVAAGETQAATCMFSVVAADWGKFLFEVNIKQLAQKPPSSTEPGKEAICMRLHH